MRRFQYGLFSLIGAVFTGTGIMILILCALTVITVETDIRLFDGSFTQSISAALADSPAGDGIQYMSEKVFAMEDSVTKAAETIAGLSEFLI